MYFHVSRILNAGLSVAEYLYIVVLALLLEKRTWVLLPPLLSRVHPDEIHSQCEGVWSICLQKITIIFPQNYCSCRLSCHGISSFKKHIKALSREGKLILKELLNCTPLWIQQPLLSHTINGSRVKSFFFHLAQLSYHLRMWHGCFESQSQESEITHMWRAWKGACHEVRCCHTRVKSSAALEQEDAGKVQPGLWAMAVGFEQASPKCKMTCYLSVQAKRTFLITSLFI